MLPLNALAVLAGQLLGIAFAAGLNLYATVAVLGTAARLGLVPPLPPGLRGLSNALVIGSAAALFLAELVMEKLPVVGAFWAAAHTIIRPLAAALLTFLAFSAQPQDSRIALAIATGLIAFAAHSAQTGLRVILASTPRPHHLLYVALAAVALDLVAIATALAALLEPATAAIIGASALLILLLTGPRLWRAASFGGHALCARLSGFFGRRGWKTGDELPRYVRRAATAAPLGAGQPRGLRAAAVGLPRAPAYRTGWLLFDIAGASFVFRVGPATRRVPVAPGEGVEVITGHMVDTIYVAAERPFRLFLLKDGPAAASAAAELAAIR